MKFPITIKYRHLVEGGALDLEARSLGRQLALLGRPVSRVCMTLDGAHATSSYMATIEVSVAGARIYADNMKVDGAGSPSMTAALCEAFNDAKRQLLALPPVTGVRAPHQADGSSHHQNNLATTRN